VRSSSRRTGPGCRSSTSASRYSATVRSVPENPAANRPGSGCPASDSAASRSPAAQPSVRSCSTARVGSSSSTPAPANSSPASATVNFKSPARISVSPPSSRSRCSPSRTSCRAAKTNRSSAGARMISSCSCRSAPGSSSCTSSITSHSRSSSTARSLSSPSASAHPSSSGAGDTARTSPAPGPVRRSAPNTDSQNRCGSRSSRPAVTHATRPASPAPAIHDRSNTVFPLPAGAHTTVTRADDPSRPNSDTRGTTPPLPPLAGRNSAGDSAASIMASASVPARW
jgi:hypothetical protein